MIYVTNNGDVNIDRTYVYLLYANQIHGTAPASPVIIRDPSTWEEIGTIKSRQRVFIEFTANPNDFKKVEYLKIVPSVGENICTYNSYWQAKSKWKITYPQV